MHAEKKFRNALHSLGSADMHPIGKARRFLAFARRAQGLGAYLMNLGFRFNQSNELSRTKRLWKGAAKFFRLAIEARTLARKALSGSSPAGASAEGAMNLTEVTTNFAEPLAARPTLARSQEVMV
jgi:anti-sigma factor RsiW